jgi:phosphoribosylanthranilate isomerase
VKIKVCGLTTPADVEACVAAGVDWVGLNFHPDSPRFVDLPKAIAVLLSIEGRAEPVGVFVDRPIDDVVAIAKALGIGLVQLHGDEPVESLPLLRGFRVIKAFRLAGPESAAAIRDYIDRAEAIGHPLHAILVDAHVAGQHGGTGVTISDDLLALIPPHPRLILAGGLTPENVAERVARVRPWMVDTASGVESEPARKCPERVSAFATAVRRLTAVD